MSNPASALPKGPVFIFELGWDPIRAVTPEFGLSLADMIQVVEPGLISPVPLAPGEILGIMNYRGRILTVVDPAPLVGLELQSAGLSTLVVLRPCHKAMGTLGLQITRARKVASEASLAPEGGAVPACISSVVQVDQQLVQIISTPALLDELLHRVVERGTAVLRQGVTQ